jgi:hypothetical protein
MAINGDYSQPVTVNGFLCKNCTDVDYAKKHIDPAHPKDGPYGVNAKDQSRDHDKADKVGKKHDVDPAARRDWTQPGLAVNVAV